jgi:hypothetical protein
MACSHGRQFPLFERSAAVERKLLAPDVEQGRAPKKSPFGVDRGLELPVRRPWIDQIVA